MRPRLWVMNLDAELELADPGYSTPSAAMRERTLGLRARLREVLPPEDRILDEDEAPRGMSAAQGVAWCPTPRALRTLERHGARPPAAPPVEVLRAVNHRRFCAEIGQNLPGACFIGQAEELERVVAGPSPSGSWLLKRPMGFAGRGQLRVFAGALPEDARRWVAASLRKGEGLQVEPLVERLEDFAIHGMLGQDGSLTLGEATTQRCSERGVWERSEPAGPGLLDGERGALEQEARRAAAALHRAGYFGPFNLDAFAWRGSGGERCFQPRCEINGRFSMGWWVGMAGKRWSVPGEEAPGTTKVAG
jgi:hypothetical protein